jgi:hypothetical protein
MFVTAFTAARQQSGRVCVYIFMCINAYKADPPQLNSYISENHCIRFPTELQILMFFQLSLYQISSYVESIKFSSCV